MVFLPGPNYALDDEFLRARLQGIIDQYNIECVVETGLNDGQSTLAFARMVPKVIGIDIDPACIVCTRERLRSAGVNTVTLETGNSPDVLRRLMPNLTPERTMFFLDAHWGGECPILDEIRAIPRGKGILVFHDFKVPGTNYPADPHDVGWDHMLVNGVYHEMSYDFLKPELTAWSPTHRIEYCTQWSASKRGSAYVFPE